MLIFLPLVAAALQAAAPAAVTVPADPALTEQIAAREGELFDLFFTGKCDLPRFRAMLADDLEFYHDKDGFAARSADDFAADFAKTCKSREDPAAWRSRRELVKGSLQVDPVPGWGAIETGDHLFFERHGAAGAEKLAGKARFAMLWVLGADKQWRLSRVFSYAHRAAK